MSYGFYLCKDCGSSRYKSHPPEKIKEDGKSFERIRIEYTCGSEMVLYRDGMNWKYVSFNHKCKPMGGFR